MESVLHREPPSEKNHEIQNLPIVVQEIILLHLGPQNFLSYLRANPPCFQILFPSFP